MNMNNKIYFLYQQLYEKYGISPEAVKARDLKQQLLRFEQLLACSDVEMDDSILDVGCGSGELLSYMRKIGLNGEYCGVDFIKEFVEHGNNFFKKDTASNFIQIDIENDDIPKSFDWVILSGVFNDLRDDSEMFFYSTLDKMFKSSTKGIVFNSLTKYVDYEDNNLFYTYPDKVMRYCLENFSKYIVLKTNYQLKKDTIPFEYSLCVYKK
tara:strand:+ start:21196 stop:21825 length:630 start_codon:yes stop_codon:yes gene_type:complete